MLDEERINNMLLDWKSRKRDLDENMKKRVINKKKRQQTSC